MGWEVVCAYFLDLLIGDPLFPFHPVRIIGNAIQHLEGMLRRTISNEKLGGSILAIIIVGSTYIITWLILKLAGAVSIRLVFVLNILFVYFTISVRDLAVHSHAVQKELECAKNPPYSPFCNPDSVSTGSRIHKNREGGDEGDYLDAARKKLSMIVGRDAKLLNEDEIIRGTVESVAEGTVDGIISPLFYAFIGGAPLAMAFKAISTLDSMVGYKNEKYINFGWLGAKLDDVANFIPARLSAILIPLAARFTGSANANRAWWTIVTDGGKSNSPNAGIPEAAYAGALGIQLGGANFYGGKKIEKPLIGNVIKNRQIEDVPRAIRLMYATSVLSLLSGVGATWIINTIIP